MMNKEERTGMKNKTTFELLQRLKRIEIEKWNLGIESTQIMEEIWRRVDALEPEKDIEVIKSERSKK